MHVELIRLKIPTYVKLCLQCNIEEKILISNYQRMSISKVGTLPPEINSLGLYLLVITTCLELKENLTSEKVKS